MSDKTPIDACPVPEGWVERCARPRCSDSDQTIRAHILIGMQALPVCAGCARAAEGEGVGEVVWILRPRAPSEAVSDADVAEKAISLRGDRGAEFDPLGHHE